MNLTKCKSSMASGASAEPVIRQPENYLNCITLSAEFQDLNTTKLDLELARLEQLMAAADVAGDDSAWAIAFTYWLDAFGRRWITPPASGQAGEVQHRSKHSRHNDNPTTNPAASH